MINFTIKTRDGRIEDANWWAGMPLPHFGQRLYALRADGDEAWMLISFLESRFAHTRLADRLVVTDWDTQGESHAG